MAAAQFLGISGGEDFFGRLQKSKLIEITYVKDYSQDPTHRDVIRLPEVLLRAISHCFNDLCESNPQETLFTAEQVLGCSDVQFYCEEGRFGAFMACFAKWIYTSKLDDDIFWPWELWRLGQLVGAPSFMNLCLQELAKCLGDSTEDVEMNRNSKNWKAKFDWTSAQLIWEEADFRSDFEHGYDLRDCSVYWGNKKMLKFALDVFLYRHVHEEGGSEDIRELLMEKDDLSMQVAKKLGAREMAPPERQPWNPRNLQRYLVDEDMSESHEECYSPITVLEEVEEDADMG
ncbi:hypothetical protein BKA61DRAFT_573066 [Leptodontidium sp. MPI-SDFR-AT-0119]|nr:hypothetical protein BKA61DRAFT_573066 [Leptodontidium sp. MPI-SDFR-AT-0119]